MAGALVMVQRPDNDQAGHVGQGPFFLLGKRFEGAQFLWQEANCDRLGCFVPVWSTFALHFFAFFIWLSTIGVHVNTQESILVQKNIPVNKSMNISIIGERLRSERERLKLSQDALAAFGGVKKLTQLGYEKGSSYPNADYLAKVAGVGVDVAYVVLGKRLEPVAIQAAPMTDEETHTLMLLQNRGIYPDSRSCRIHMQGLVLVLEYIREVKRGKPIALTDVELAKIATFSPTESRAWVFHPVTLTPRPTGPTNQTLLVYRCKTPVSVAWQLGPFDTGVPDRFEVSGWPAFPIKIRSEGDGTEHSSELSLDLNHIEQFARGQLVHVSAISVEQARAQIDSDMAYLNSLPPPN